MADQPKWRNIIVIFKTLLQGFLKADFMTPCDFTDKNVIGCIKTKMDTYLKEFSKGLPTLKVPTLDPIYVGEIVNKHPSLEFTFRNTEVHGIGDIHIKELIMENNVLPTNFKIKFVGNLSLTTHYTAKGQIMILPLNGEGNGSANTTNIMVEFNTVMEEYTDSKSKQHLRFANVKYKYDIESARFDFDNLLKGNKQLSDTILQVVNDNWEQLWEELAPKGVSQIVKTVKNAINKFFEAIPNDRLFLNYKPGLPWGSGE